MYNTFLIPTDMSIYTHILSPFIWEVQSNNVVLNIVNSPFSAMK